MSCVAFESAVPFEGVEKRLVVQFAPHTVALSGDLLCSSTSTKNSSVRPSTLPSTETSTSMRTKPVTNGMKVTDQEDEKCRYRFGDPMASVVVPSPLHMSVKEWQTILDDAHCEIVSVKDLGSQKVYLLSESTLLVWETGFLLKTCGRTTPFAALTSFLRRCCCVSEDSPLEEGDLLKRAGVNWMTFTRLDFLHPQYQQYPHQSFDQEIDYALQNYTSSRDLLTTLSLDAGGQTVYALLYADPTATECSRPYFMEEALMLGIHENCASHFTNFDNAEDRQQASPSDIEKPSVIKKAFRNLSRHVLDEFWFSPCGYSSNALMLADNNSTEELYFSCHISPEPATSYASLEVGRSTGHVSAFSELSAFRLTECLPAFAPKSVHAVRLFIYNHDAEESQDHGDQKVNQNRDLCYHPDSRKNTTNEPGALINGFELQASKASQVKLGSIKFVVQHLAFRSASIDQRSINDQDDAKILLESVCTTAELESSSQDNTAATVVSSEEESLTPFEQPRICIC